MPFGVKKYQIWVNSEFFHHSVSQSLAIIHTVGVKKKPKCPFFGPRKKSSHGDLPKYLCEVSMWGFFSSLKKVVLWFFFNATYFWGQNPSVMLKVL